MTNKELFIKEIKGLIEDGFEFSEGANAYFEALQTKSSAKERPEITENGIKILKFMQENYEKFNNVFNSKDIGEGLFVSSRSVSGSMPKLITNGYVEKIGADPVTYAITEQGKVKEL